MEQQYALGIDIGGTNTAFGIVNGTGDIVAQGSMRTAGHNHVQDYIADLRQKVMPLIDGVGKHNMAGAGIGAPNGNFFTGEIAFAPNLPWKGIIPLANLVA